MKDKKVNGYALLIAFVLFLNGSYTLAILLMVSMFFIEDIKTLYINVVESFKDFYAKKSNKSNPKL